MRLPRKQYRTLLDHRRPQWLDARGTLIATSEESPWFLDVTWQGAYGWLPSHHLRFARNARNDRHPYQFEA